MALRFIVAIALSALIGLSCGRPATDSPAAEPGSSKAEPYLVYPGNTGAKPSYQKNGDISYLYNWLKNHKFDPWKPTAENKPIAEPMSEPKPEPYYPYMPKVVPPHTHVPKHTHGHMHTVTHSRTDQHVLPPHFAQYPYGFRPPQPYGFPSRFQIPPFPYPPMKPVYRYPFPPTFGYPFNQQQKDQRGQVQQQAYYQPKYPMFPPTMGPGGAVGGPFLPPFLPPAFPPFRGFPYGQPNQGKFGGYATNVYNSVGNGNGMFGSRIVNPGSFGFGGILNSIKGSSSTPFLPKPYPFVPLQPKYGYPPVILN
ncbi:trithorax group protein osa [Octopus bimaculoides]|uniref:Uncharacterized protein n=1 Tax=Octopus bimaculoides TaxID=37653 RepID=A0A0L8FQB9_OCTBM|nr:trithorax group protein osa [Octopus bimaculoides]|eukprot:XP_014787866.1 PREDICTED: uncharacterized protein LOC106881862 [Octopus bimaculoides]